MNLPPIITCSRLRELLNDGNEKPISRTTLHHWITTDPKWRGCIARSSKRKYWLSTQRLIDNGILMRPAPAPVVAMPGLGFTYRAVGIA